MKITIEPTAQIVEIRTPMGLVPARVWQGHADNGVPVQALITRLVPVINRDDPAQSAFERELVEQNTPRPGTEVFPMRLIL